MLNLFMTMLLSYKNFVSSKATNAAIAWSEKNLPDFFREFCAMIAAILTPVGGIAILLMVAYQLRKIIFILVMIPLLFASYRANHTGNVGTVDDIDEEQTPYDRALELYPVMLSFVFKVLVSASSSTVIDRKHDVRDIKVISATDAPFSMKNGVAIYPFEVTITDEITLDQAEELRDELQRIGRNYISDFPQLISVEAGKHDPFEVLAVHSLGRRIHIDVVQTTAASLPMINNCRRARAKRKNDPPRPPRYIDSDYGDE